MNVDDELAFLRAARPPVEPLDEVSWRATRADLLAAITGGPSLAASARRPVPTGRRWVVSIAALATLVATAAGWRLLAQDPATTTAIVCSGEVVSGQIVIGPVSGDPVADCEEEWRRATGDDPPPLVAYQNEWGGVSVLPEGEPVPAGWQRLEEAFRQDPRIIELRSRLEDVGHGLSSGCLAFEQGKVITDGVLDAMGFQGWSVVSEHGLADGVETCAIPIVQPERSRVLLAAVVSGFPGELDPLRAMARSLATRLAATCLPIEDAEEIARQEARSLEAFDVPPDAVAISSLPAPGVPCTDSTVSVGGSIRIILRGPTRG